LADNDVVTKYIREQDIFHLTPVPLSWNVSTGTANAFGFNEGSFLQLGLSGPTAVAGNYRESILYGASPMNRNGSGAANIFANSRFSIMLEMQTNGIVAGSNEIRLLLGVATSQDLSVAGMGVVWNSLTTLKLQIHNGSTLSETSDLTIPIWSNPSRFLIVWDGSKLSIGAASNDSTNAGVFPRFTKIGELVGSSIPTNCGGANWKMVNMATGTTVYQHNVYVKSNLYVPYAINIDA